MKWGTNKNTCGVAVVCVISTAVVPGSCFQIGFDFGCLVTTYRGMVLGFAVKVSHVLRQGKRKSGLL